jgi:hypothetical protein
MTKMKIIEAGPKLQRPLQKETHGRPQQRLQALY